MKEVHLQGGKSQPRGGWCEGSKREECFKKGMISMSVLPRGCWDEKLVPLDLQHVGQRGLDKQSFRGMLEVDAWLERIER